MATRHVTATLRQIWRILRTLFLEIVGFVFLVLAGWGGLWLIRSFREFDGDGEALFKLVLVSGFVVMMGSFGISSFWRARRISRNK